MEMAKWLHLRDIISGQQGTAILETGPECWEYRLISGQKTQQTVEYFKTEHQLVIGVWFRGIDL